ncbi:CD80-like immunoglobulin C2-set [Trinorchestia longiramus]|nr:CD80-like immunoglobulin C2-set [Trinorchestia longiramus]
MSLNFSSESPSKVWIGSSSSGVATKQNSSANFVVRRLVEGGTLRLTCYAQGGHPVPQITWWDGDHRLDTADLTQVTESKEVFSLGSEKAKDDQEDIVTVDRAGSTIPEIKKTLHNVRHRKEGKRELQGGKNVTVLYRKRDARKRINNNQGVTGSQSVKTLYPHTSDSLAQIPNTEAFHTQTSSIFMSRRRPRSLSTLSSNSPISQTRISNIQKLKDGLHSNSLVVEALGREDLHRIFTCRVANSNVTNAIFRTATLDMILNPIRLRMDPSPAPLMAGRVSVFVCTTTGDRPPVQLIWTLDGQPIQHSNIQVNTTSLVHWRANSLAMREDPGSRSADASMRNGDETVSRLSITLSPDHDSAQLTCSFTPLHPRLQPFSDSVQLRVEYAPTVHLTPGRSVSLSDVREGDDVYFECTVSARPPVSSIRWQRQGEDFRHSTSKGIILSNRSLVLQRVSKTNSGNYTCSATNSRGTGVSNTLQLIVKYAPKCGEQKWSTKGASIGSKVVVPCVLDALPPTSEVTWTFNSTSGHTARIDQEKLCRNPRQSHRELAAEAGVSKTLMFRALKEDPRKKPYKMINRHELTELHERMTAEKSRHNPNDSSRQAPTLGVHR